MDRPPAAAPGGDALCAAPLTVTSPDVARAPDARLGNFRRRARAPRGARRRQLIRLLWENLTIERRYRARAATRRPRHGRRDWRRRRGGPPISGGRPARVTGAAVAIGPVCVSRRSPHLCRPPGKPNRAALMDRAATPPVGDVMHTARGDTLYKRRRGAVRPVTAERSE